ncbi:MAG: pyridoxamine 5'-phosphate oxidase family protein [Pseudomonadales bacterium]
MIVLTEEIKRRLADGLTDGHPVVAGYVDRSGDPHVSLYGSVHAHSDDQLALWVRNADGELLAAIGRNPKIGFVYSDMSIRTFYRMYGRARVESDEATRDRVFEGMHQFEQQQDPERKGTAVVVDLDTVGGRDESGRFSMERD